MGIEVSWAGAALLAGGAYSAKKGVDALSGPDVATASDINKQAKKKTDLRARKRAQDVERNKTVFTSPGGVAGMKKKLGQ